MFTIEDLSKKTVMEIKSYAKKNNIDLLGASKKIEMIDAISNWIPSKVEVKVEPKKEVKLNGEKVAVFSERNIFWNNVGTLEKGYNIVTKEASEKWVTHKAVRSATPQEVASYYGK